jgi:hyaluronan synthase
VLFSGSVILIAAAVWSAHHVAQVIAVSRGTSTNELAVVYAVTFGFLVIQATMYHFERPRRCTPRQRRQLDALRAEVLIPVYQEDPGYLWATFESLFTQTRPPQAIHVVDDGSSIDYSELRGQFLTVAKRLGVVATWQRQVNAGKRHAQATGVRVSPEAQVYITVDSDARLDPNAIEELLLPLADSRVQSVAGIVIAANNRVNLLARFTDLYYVTGQLTDRSALSAVSSVLVNSGVLAAYRAEVIRDNLEGYLSETIAGRPVTFSDDSMLTLYALMRGKTVQQPTSIVYTAMPEKISHALRQYLRWMRGSTIRSLWRLRYLPATRLAYWLHLWRWMQMAIATAVFVYLVVVQPLNGKLPTWAIVAAPVLIGYAQGLRYLTIKRSDESLWSQLLTWSLTPLAVAWAWFVLRSVRWYAMFTCLKTGWGTRQKGAEVTMEAT